MTGHLVNKIKKKKSGLLSFPWQEKNTNKTPSHLAKVKRRCFIHQIFKHTQNIKCRNTRKWFSKLKKELANLVAMHHLSYHCKGCSAHPSTHNWFLAVARREFPLLCITVWVKYFEGFLHFSLNHWGTSSCRQCTRLNEEPSLLLESDCAPSTHYSSQSSRYIRIKKEQGKCVCDWHLEL